MDAEDSLDAEQVARYAERAGVDVAADAAAALAEQFAEQDAALAALADLEPEAPPDRESWTPGEDEDPLGAWLARCDLAREDADGQLSGLTVGLKDNVAVAGVPMTCGSPLLAERDYRPREDATVTERLLDAGARVVGKTNMDEFAFGGDRDTMRLRLARNPHDPERQPGSSSAGSGVAAATGAVDLAVGSDTGGSVRFPAAWCGVAGVKPSRGLVSHDGFVQFAKTLDSVGFLAAEVDHLALGLDAVAGPDPRDERTHGADPGDHAGAVAAAGEEPLAVGVPGELFGDAPDVDPVVEAALDELAADGAELREVSIPDYELWLPAWLGIGLTEAGNYLRAAATGHPSLSPGRPALSRTLGAALREDAADLGEPLLAALLYAEHRRATDGNAAYALAHRARRRLAEGVDAALADVDVLAGPTVPMLPPRWDAGIDDVFGALSNTGPFNVAGHPAVSVPCGTVDGLPVGLQFVAGRGEDPTALRAGARWERVHDD
jgi:Asp-tRNA(Asn)/Glu-tRNA(Gln) amidotransferase A subunit family amidase